MLKTIAQIIGFIPLVLSAVIFLSDDRKKVLYMKMLSDGLYGLHFFLLGAPTGAVMGVVNVIRGYVFSKKGEKGVNGYHIPILFCCINLLSAVLSWEGIRSLFPCVGSSLAIVGFWCNDIQSVRKYTFCGIALWVVYGVMTGSISVVIANTLSLISIAVASIKYVKKQKEQIQE